MSGKGEGKGKGANARREVELFGVTPDQEIGRMVPNFAGEALPGGMEETQIGRYVILKEIGRGGQSRVYLARDPAIERTVAIKQIRAATELSEEFRAQFVARFLQEARVAGTLSHPNIVSIYDIGEDEAGPYIVMEFVDGETLDGIIERSDPRDRQTIIPIVLQICSGLSFAHQHGVVHRDVKPANIMLTSNGLVKLVDFGVARVASTNLTQTGTLLGTPSYMSPEQIQGEKVDQRSDIFSLGIVLYEVLTGRLPFEGKNPTTMIFRIVNDPHSPLAEIDAALAGDFGPIIDQCLEKSAADRYQDCRELAEDLSRLLPGDHVGENLFDTTMGTAAAISTTRPGPPETDTKATWVGSRDTLLAETALTRAETEWSLPVSRKTLGIIGGAAGAVLILVALLVAANFGPEDPESLMAGSGVGSVETASPPQELLREARAALDAGKLVGEGQDDALYLAQNALALGETTAQEMIDQVQERLREQTLRQIRNVTPRAAVTTYEAFLSYFPDDEQIITFKTQMQRRIAQANQLRQVENLAVRGQSALAEGDLDEASRNFERILRAAPNDSYAAHMLGKTHAAKGDLASARRYLERAVSLSPLDPTAQMDLADVLEGLGDYEETATAIHRAIGLGAGKAAGPGVLEARLERLQVRKELKTLLPIQSDGKHTHFLRRSCRGTLTVTADSIEYVPVRNQDHALQFQLADLQSFKMEKGTLAISGPDGKKYNFDELGEEPSQALGKLLLLLDSG